MKRSKRFLRIQRVSDGWWFSHVTGNDQPQQPGEVDGIVWTPERRSAKQIDQAGLRNAMAYFFRYWKGDAHRGLRFRWYRRGPGRSKRNTSEVIGSLGGTIRVLREELANADRRHDDLVDEHNKLLERHHKAMAALKGDES